MKPTGHIGVRLPRGMAYFAYHFNDAEHAAGLDSAMLDPSDQPTGVFWAAAGLSPEMINLGRSLRLLTSTDVRFVPGKHEWLLGKIDNSTPSGLSDWSSGAGDVAEILDVDVDHAVADSYGTANNGLLGFFTDDAGQQYFMLANLYHEANSSAADTSLTLTIDFQPSVDRLLMLDRTTGVQEIVPLVDHRLTVTLPGGTGNLYKYDRGDFAGLGPPLGDVNLDGDVNGLDVAPFLNRLVSGLYRTEADMNQDDVVNGLDVDLFVTTLAMSGARAIPEPSTWALAGLALALAVLGSGKRAV